MTWKVTGVSRNNAGAALGSCECFLFKYNSGTGLFTQTGAKVTSDGSGNYAFTGLTDNASAYCVAFFKNGSPNVFDITDRNLTPVVEPAGAGTTWNPADKGSWNGTSNDASKGVLSNGNLTLLCDASAGGGARSTTSHTSGLYYFEVNIDVCPDSYAGSIGTALASRNFDPNNYNVGPLIRVNGGQHNGSNNLATVPAGSKLGFIYNFNNRTGWIVCSDSGSDWGSWAWPNASGGGYGISVINPASPTQSLDLSSITLGSAQFIYAIGLGSGIGGSQLGITLNTAGPFANPNAAAIAAYGYGTW